ncbi:hypothetical protein D9611_005546 [Ephemerocybe angulata]|uniref:Uncharacterized protein n=1 Tax=Ephemerocybe angulata TaxID=980116 RepID=A0A8H5BHE7_9AGAR|nr:hypothetical protein D9611_005546 [Tulosesus angulatus]
MSAIPTDEPAQDAPPSIDHIQQQLQQQQQQHVQQVQDVQLASQSQMQQQPGAQTPESARKRNQGALRATRLCRLSHRQDQSCLKRGLGASCAYPDPEAQQQQQQQPDHAHHTPAPAVAFAPPPMYAPIQGAPNLAHQQYYDYTNGTFAPAPSTSTFRPNKRPRNLTEEEAAAITRNFTRGDFYVGSSAPVRIDPRLPVRLTLGEGDQVHFTVGETLV